MQTLDPQRNPSLLGHDEALRQVATAFEAGRMPQAWLITGIEGIGKATLAYHVAHYVLARGKTTLGRLNMDLPSSRLIAADAHPDLFVLQRAVDDKTGVLRDTIAVDDARAIAPALHNTAALGGWRVAVIDGAQNLNRFGQNAILKIIEEPPPRCLILITVTTAGMLLPTIRSRCRLLPLHPLSDGVMRSVLARMELDSELGPDGIQTLVRLSGGSVGFALKLHQAEALPLFGEMKALLRDMPELDIPRLHALADKVGRKADADAFAVLSQLLVGELQEAARAEALAGAPLAQVDHAVQLWEKVAGLFQTAQQASLDKKLAFIQALTEIRRAFA